ncbi:hypothetical protein J2T18_001950 [Paenibacillus polymyxa]|nr:hypothetical protein [Paenibacillus polymyxa]
MKNIITFDKQKIPSIIILALIVFGLLFGAVHPEISDKFAEGATGTVKWFFELIQGSISFLQPDFSKIS